MKKEIWKPVVGYENLYEVSNFGRVKSLNYNHSGKERILKSFTNKDGYLYVDLCKNGKRKKYRIHRLVAQAFMPNTDNLPCINHKDENKQNNNIDNLEWCTAKYNINFGTRTERRIKTISKPVLQYTLDGEFVKKYSSTIEVERNNSNFNHTSISRCCRGKQKTYKGFIWKYL